MIKIEIMNKIQKFAAEVISKRVTQESVVSVLNAKISRTIGMSVREVPDDFRYEFGKWAITKQCRLLEEGWTYLFEIQLAEHKHSYGYSNSENPDWIEVRGTMTKNVPPEQVVDEFFTDLEDHLTDKVTLFLN
jgi:hypothetical protein